MSDGFDPWLSRPTESPQVVPIVTAAPGLTPTGPVAPQRDVRAPDRVDQLPTYDRPSTTALWCVGTHGGAGESTIARLVAGAVEAGHGWPRLPQGAGRARVVLVARSSARGLRAAQAAATQWAAGAAPDVEV